MIDLFVDWLIESLLLPSNHSPLPSNSLSHNVWSYRHLTHLIEVTTEAGGALVNVTKEAACMVIEEVGKESKRLVPIMLGVVTVVILVSLNVLVSYFWKKHPKQKC